MNAQPRAGASPVDQAIRRRQRERVRDWIIVAIAFCIAAAVGLLHRHGVF